MLLGVGVTSECGRAIRCAVSDLDAHTIRSGGDTERDFTRSMLDCICNQLQHDELDVTQSVLVEPFFEVAVDKFARPDLARCCRGRRPTVE